MRGLSAGVFIGGEVGCPFAIVGSSISRGCDGSSAGLLVLALVQSGSVA